MLPCQNYSLKSKNTFGFDVRARHFLATNSAEELQCAFAWAKTNRQPVFLLGGGSNLVLTRDIPGLTVQQLNAVINIESEGNNHVSLYASAAVKWHDLVMFCVDREFYGIENLSLIPGSTGAAPIQNIGAYGVELNHVLESVDVLNIENGEQSVLIPEECSFGYRESKFKHEWKSIFAITGIRLRLNKNRQFNLSYSGLASELSDIHPDDLTIRQVSDTVCSVRQRKLPNPVDIGNAGSFFKNPEITATQYKLLRETAPTVPSHQLTNGNIKIPAAWLVDQAGWKGFEQSGVGVHKNQAIVLVNNGGGSGEKIVHLAQNIQNDIFEKFGVTLNIEPVIV